MGWQDALPLPVALPFSLALVRGLVVLDGRRFALVLAGVLLQQLQSFGLAGGLDCGAGAGGFLPLLPRWNLPSVRGEGVAGREIRA